MAQTTRQRVHALLDELPDDDVPFVLRVLRALRAEADPVRRALDEAPDDDEPVTEEDRAALAEAWEDVQAGRTVPHEAVRAGMQKAS